MKDRDLGFQFLGVDRDNADIRYLMSIRDSMVIGRNVSRLSGENELLSIGNGEAWKTAFPKINAEGLVTGFDKVSAFAWFIENSHADKIGIYIPGKVRGKGIWRDAGRVVVHFGNWLLVDGKKKQLGGIETEFFYSRSDPIQVALEGGLTLADKALILEILDSFDWEDGNVLGKASLHKELFLGFLCEMMICGGLDWRTHLWLIGTAGTGKSTLWKLASNLTLVFHKEFQGSSTSEAGVRQEVGCDAVPILLDEMEGDTAKTENRITGVVEYLRTCSTDGSAPITKGGMNHKAVRFQGRSMGLLSSINPVLLTMQDKERFIVVSLVKPRLSSEAAKRIRTARYRELKGKIDSIGKDFSARLFQHGIENLESIVDNVKELEVVLIRKTKDQREAKSYGTPLSAAYNFRYGRKGDEKEMAEYINQFNWGDMEPKQFDFDVAKQPMGLDEETSAEKQLFNILLTTIIRVEGNDGRIVDRTVMQLLDDIHTNSSPFHQTLERYGLRWNPAKRKLFVASSHQFLKKLYANTAASAGWNGIFKRLPGAEQIVKDARVGGMVLKGRWIEIPAVEEFVEEVAVEEEQVQKLEKQLTLEVDKNGW
jgi:putative DNA primase/helicase